MLAGPPGGVEDLAFSRDGSRIAMASVDGLVRLFDAETDQPELRLPGAGFAVEGVAFRPDGMKLASGVDVRTRGEPRSSVVRARRCRLGSSYRCV